MCEHTLLAVLVALAAASWAWGASLQWLALRKLERLIDGLKHISARVDYSPFAGEHSLPPVPTDHVRAWHPLPAEPRGPTVLIVDDDAITRMSLRQLLSAAGARVVEAANGLKALEALRAGPTPDLVLLDLRMPVMDGWEFLRRWRAEASEPAAAVVVFSGVSDVRDAAMDLGAAAFLPKPIDAEEVLDLLRRFGTCP